MMASEKRQWTAGRITALIFAGVLPLLLLLLGVLQLLGDAVVTWSFAFTFLILPCAVFTGCFFEIRSKHHVAVKSILCVLLLSVMVFLTLIMMAVGHYSVFAVSEGDDAIAEYQRDTQNIETMPEISELGQPEAMKYTYFFNLEFTFLIRIATRCSAGMLRKRILNKRLCWRNAMCFRMSPFQRTVMR